jgi:LysM repeat protein
LLKANNLHSARLTPGQTLLIPYTVTNYALGGRKAAGIHDGSMIALAETAANPQVNALANTKVDAQANIQTNDEAMLYTVKNGETLWGIAHKHKVSPSQIRKWNNLKSNAIHAGLRLRISEA